MKKEEKKSDLEGLLNSLIEKGWKPFGESRIDEINRAEQYAGNWNWCCWGGAMQKRKSTRQLVSKESGLWQFVCENELYPPYIQHRWFRDLPTNGLQIHDYRYWVIESALCDEDKLEDFILDNVKID